MHTARQLFEEAFEIRIDGEPAIREELLPDWGVHDRLGVVMSEPFGAIGASHLIQLAITAYYDARPDRREGLPKGKDDRNPKAIYPDIYLFHVGGRYGDHSAFDFWPARKEVFVPNDPRVVLDAINDRAITCLLVSDQQPIPIEHEFKEPAAARDLIRSVFAYDASGRVADPDVEIRGLQSRTEANPTRVLDPDRRYSGLPAGADDDHPDPDLRARSWPVRTEQRRSEAAESLPLARSRREAVRVDGLATETYRRIDLDDALSMLVSGP